MPVEPADTVDRIRCSRSSSVARFSRRMECFVGQQAAADASAGSADVDACSARAAVRTWDSDDGSDFDAKAVADFESFDLLAA